MLKQTTIEKNKKKNFFFAQINVSRTINEKALLETFHLKNSYD